MIPFLNIAQNALKLHPSVKSLMNNYNFTTCWTVINWNAAYISRQIQYCIPQRKMVDTCK